MFNITVQIPQNLTPDPNRLREELKRFARNMGKWIIRETTTKYLTDPGRPFRRVRVRVQRTERYFERDPETGQVIERTRTYTVGSYRNVPIYPREKIGVITGRLRASIGANWQGDILGGGVYQEQETNRGIIIHIGTNVKYAPRLQRIKYDFLEKGVESAFNVYGEREIMGFFERLAV
jgi:hypothetical protein